jgi:putative FmdB family regulatory protein
MPLYDFRCETCGKTHEVLAKVDEKVSCPECGGEMEKLVSTGFSFELRGSGWARDGYHDVVPRRSI